MNWEAAGAIAEILGVIAVIGSLIYVGRQINQNTDIARANMVHETGTLSTQFYQLIAQDSELADIYDRGITGVSLNRVDLRRFTALVTMYMTWLEDLDSQATAGLYLDPPPVTKVRLSICRKNFHVCFQRRKFVTGGTTVARSASTLIS